MSEPRDCRCPNCHCPSGTRNPDGLCRSCSSGTCKGEVRRPEWVRRASTHDDTYSGSTPGELADSYGTGR